MKKVLLIVFVIIGLASCDILSSIIDTTTYGLLEGIEFYDFADYDLTGIDSYRDIARWIQMRVEYKADFLEAFSSPEETLRRRSGDCEDYAFLFANIAYLTMGIKMDVVILYLPTGRTVVEGGIGNHIDVYYDGLIISAQRGYISYYQEVLYTYTFNEVFH